MGPENNATLWPNLKVETFQIFQSIFKFCVSNSEGKVRMPPEEKFKPAPINFWQNSTPFSFMAPVQGFVDEKLMEWVEARELIATNPKIMPLCGPTLKLKLFRFFSQFSNFV